MNNFLAILIPGIVFILVVGNIFAVANYARDLRKEMIVENRKRAPIGRSTKRKKTSLKVSIKRKRNHIY